MDNVNRNDAGYVDFEKVVNLDGIALINVVGNPQEAPLTRRKLLQTRITHNDGMALGVPFLACFTHDSARWELEASTAAATRLSG